jgi:hypothetical protein
MNKLFYTLCLLTLTSMGIFAQENVVASPDSIKFEKTTHDYGTIDKGSDGTCEFKFTNKGKSGLILNNVQASCGCTVPEWPKEPIASGKTGVIKVKYNTNTVSAFSKTVTVKSNAKNSSVVLTIKGQVVAKQ